MSKLLAACLYLKRDPLKYISDKFMQIYNSEVFFFFFGLFQWDAVSSTELFCNSELQKERLHKE